MILFPCSLWQFMASTLTGLMLGFAFLDSRLSMWGWIGLVPLILLLRYKDHSRNFLAGWLVGFFWFLVACHWLRHVTWIGCFSLCLFEATWLGLWMMLAGLFPLFWRILVFPSLWVAEEFLRSKGELGFSWNLIGHLSGPLAPLAQGWGVFGISFLMVGFNALLAWLVACYLLKRRLAAMPEGAGFFLILPLIWLGVGWWEIQPVPKPSDQIRTAIVQGNFPQSLKWQVPVQEAVDRYVNETSRLAFNEPVDLICWPEVSIPAILSESPSLFEFLAGRVIDWRVPLLFGILDEDSRSRKPFPLYNSAVLLDPADLNSSQKFTDPRQVSWFLRGEPQQKASGSAILPSAEASFPDLGVLGSPSAWRNNLRDVIRVYDKARLLPFGEYVPLGKVLTFIQDFVEKSGGGAFSSGRAGKVLETRFGPIGPLICFESTHAGLARRAVLNGAVVLANLTNDAWFLQSAAAEQHARQCRFRAIETGRAVIRAANTGISGIYLPNGDLTSELPPWTVSGAIADVPLFEHLTFAVRVGDFFAWLCLVCLAFSVNLMRAMPRHMAEALEPPS